MLTAPSISRVVLVNSQQIRLLHYALVGETNNELGAR